MGDARNDTIRWASHPGSYRYVLKSASAAPPTVGILELFDDIELPKLRSDDCLVQTFQTDLSEKLIRTLKLAKVPEEACSWISSTAGGKFEDPLLRKCGKQGHLH